MKAPTGNIAPIDEYIGGFAARKRAAMRTTQSEEHFVTYKELGNDIQG